MIVPVTYDAAGESSHATASATSIVVPMRCIGLEGARRARRSGAPAAACARADYRVSQDDRPAAAAVTRRHPANRLARAQKGRAGLIARIVDRDRDAARAVSFAIAAPIPRLAPVTISEPFVGFISFEF